jgi:ABC-type uncharacterized transport system permease subunit
MSQADERAALEAYSRAEISRAELERRLKQEISFGDLLKKLWANRLPLPRYASDPNSAGVQLIRALASREQRAG